MNARDPFAARLARRLIRPGVLDEGLRSGLFISFQGSGTSLESFRAELAVEIVGLGALVVDLNLTRSDASPESTLRERLAKVLTEQCANQVARPSTESVNSARLTLAEIFVTIAGRSEKDVVLILGHIGVLSDESGHQLLRGLKAARDAVNTCRGGMHHLIVVGWDTDVVGVRKLVQDEAQPFFGASVELLSAR